MPWARRPAGYYRELSLKQITEAMASGGSSKSSVGGKNSQPPLITRDFKESREARVKTEERGNRQRNDIRRRRMQTLGDEIKLMTNDSPMKNIRFQQQRRKIQSSADNRPPFPTTYIL